MKFSPRSITPPQRQRQSGVSLIIVLLILVIVSLLGAGGAQMALMAERTSRADRDGQVAFEAAEAALQDAITDVDGPNTASAQRLAIFTAANKQGFEIGCNSAGLCLPNPAGSATDVWTDVFTDASMNSKTVAYGTYTGRQMKTTAVGGLQPAKLPRYIIEALDHHEIGANAIAGASKSTMYRITAIGFGPNPNAKVMLQIEYENQAGQ